MYKYFPMVNLPLISSNISASPP